MSYGDAVQRFMTPSAVDLSGTGGVTAFTWKLPADLSICLQRLSAICVEAVAANGGQGVMSVEVDGTEIGTIQPAASAVAGQEVMGTFATATKRGDEIAGGSTIEFILKTQGTGAGTAHMVLHYQEVQKGA